MYLVFDVGGTFIKYALMDQKGKIYEKYKVPTPFQDGKVDDNGDEITPYTVKTEDGIAAFLEQIDIRVLFMVVAVCLTLTGCHLAI